MRSFKLPKRNVTRYLDRVEDMVNAIRVRNTYNVAFSLASRGGFRATTGDIGERARFVERHAVRFASAAALYRACVRFGR